MNITEQQRLELMGLIALGRQHYRVIDQVYDGITKIVGEEGSHLHDAVFEIEKTVDIDKLLALSEIEVGKNAKKS